MDGIRRLFSVPLIRVVSHEGPDQLLFFVEITCLPLRFADVSSTAADIPGFLFWYICWYVIKSHIENTQHAAHTEYKVFRNAKGPNQVKSAQASPMAAACTCP